MGQSTLLIGTVGRRLLFDTGDSLQTGTQFVRSLLGKRVSRKATGTSNCVTRFTTRDLRSQTGKVHTTSTAL
jgi:hypothetical protein